MSDHGPTRGTQFSNFADSARDTVDGYVSAVLGLLGDRDPMEVLSSTPDAIRSALKGVANDKMVVAEAPGKWSIAQVLQHLADSETVWAYRLRRVLAEDRPILDGYDQDKWAERFGYSDVPPSESLDLFVACRKSNLRLLRRLEPGDLSRVGVHRERGEESVSHMLALYAGHDLVHTRQIKRIAEHLHGD